MATIDFSTLTEANFNGTALTEINYNGTSVWTQPSAGSVQLVWRDIFTNPSVVMVEHKKANADYTVVGNWSRQFVFDTDVNQTLTPLSATSAPAFLQGLHLANSAVEGEITLVSLSLNMNNAQGLSLPISTTRYWQASVEPTTDYVTHFRPIIGVRINSLPNPTDATSHGAPFIYSENPSITNHINPMGGIIFSNHPGFSYVTGASVVGTWLPYASTSVQLYIMGSLTSNGFDTKGVNEHFYAQYTAATTNTYTGVIIPAQWMVTGYKFMNNKLYYLNGSVVYSSVSSMDDVIQLMQSDPAPYANSYPGFLVVEFDMTNKTVTMSSESVGQIPSAYAAGVPVSLSTYDKNGNPLWGIF